MRFPLRLCLLTVVLFNATAFTQPLADKVPADAIVYFGWAGTEGLPPGYADSHLKAIVDNSKVRELFTEFIPQAANRLAMSQPNARQPIELARMLLTQMLKHPTAFYFAGMDVSNPQHPFPRMGILCRAGADAAGIQNWLQPLLAQAPPDVPVKSSIVQDLLVVTIGYSAAAQGVATSSSLKQSDTFTAAIRNVQADAVVASYVDFERVLSMVDNLLQIGANPEARTLVGRVIEASGLRGLKRMVGTSGFDGKDWMSQAFVEAPAPRSGLLESLDSKPMSADLLKTIPADSTFAASGRFDAAKFVMRIRDIVGQADPQAQQVFDQGLGIVQMAMARNLVSDLLEPLGDDWAAYCSPAVGGNGALGMVVVNHLHDPAKATSSLPIAWVNASNWVNTLLRRNRADVEVIGRTIDIGGMNINYVGSPAIAPAWTIKDGNLYIGLYPQPVAAAARWMARGEKSIADNPKFVALQKRLAVKDPTSFSFYDLQASAAQGSSYQALLLLARYAGFGDLFGVPLPEPLVPPLDILQQHLSPAGSMGWVDDAGYHVKEISPFPGSKMLSEPGMMMAAGGPGTSALMVSIMLPSLNRARETANRVKCAANMKSIGMALLLYANDHQGKYPNKLSALLENEVPVEAFVCPSSNNAVPPNVRNGGKQAMADWIDAHADYVYLGAGKTSSEPADTIILYEKSEDHNQAGVNMLFGDGHVEWNALPNATRMIARQKQAAGQ